MATITTIVGTDPQCLCQTGVAFSDLTLVGTLKLLRAFSTDWVRCTTSTGDWMSDTATGTSDVYHSTTRFHFRTSRWGVARHGTKMVGGQARGMIRSQKGSYVGVKTQLTIVFEVFHTRRCKSHIRHYDKIVHSDGNHMRVA